MAKHKKGTGGPKTHPGKATASNSQMIHGGAHGDCKAAMPKDSAQKHEWHAAKSGKPSNLKGTRKAYPQKG